MPPAGPAAAALPSQRTWLPCARRLEGRSLPASSSSSSPAQSAAAAAAAAGAAARPAPGEPSSWLTPRLPNSAGCSASAACSAAVKLAGGSQEPPLSRSCRLAAPGAPGTPACHGWWPVAQLAFAAPGHPAGCSAEPCGAGTAAAAAAAVAAAGGAGRGIDAGAGAGGRHPAPAGGSHPEPAAAFAAATPAPALAAAAAAAGVSGARYLGARLRGARGGRPPPAVGCLPMLAEVEDGAAAAGRAAAGSAAHAAAAADRWCSGALVPAWAQPAAGCSPREASGPSAAGIISTRWLGCSRRKASASARASARVLTSCSSSYAAAFRAGSGCTRPPELVRFCPAVGTAPPQA